MHEAKSFRYIFVDESGDLGEHGSKYFIIACLSTSDPKPIRRLIKKVRERKLKKKLKDVPELKANSSGPEIRKEVLSRLAECDCKIDLIIIKKETIMSSLYNVKNRLYNYVFGLLIDVMEIHETNLEIIIDKKDSNRLLRDDLDQYIYSKITLNKPACTISIMHIESHCDPALQVVDFVAWSANRKYSFGNDEYYAIIEKKVEKTLTLWK